MFVVILINNERSYKNIYLTVIPRKYEFWGESCVFSFYFQLDNQLN